jgi:peptidoglycan/LPS O-acetylase OafA/YrhL
MTTPSPALHAQLRPVIGAQWINLGLCVLLLSVAFALRDSVAPAVWVRATIILLVSLFLLLCGRQMLNGRRWAYIRAKWIAALGAIGFVGVAALPGPFPAWMRIEQGAQALLFVALAWMLTRPALALFFPRVKAPIHTALANPLADTSARDARFDYLRAFIVRLVVLHHSVIAYATIFPAQPSTFKILSAPIVDPQRWAGFDLLLSFNDTFFMALMFLLSGLFVWPSLQRKGGANFLRDRLFRLGIPFIVAVAILMPLAYYPSYLASGADPALPAYASAWASLGFLPSGPAWFISLLLVFDVAATGIYMLWPRWLAYARAAQNVGLYARPAAFLAVLLVVSALVYIPMALAFGADRWLAFGPISFQASRLLLYATYFLAGLGMGALGAERGFIARNGGLARQWPIWVVAGLAAFALRLAIIIILILPLTRAHQPLPLATRLLSDLTFVLCCGAISFAFIALFCRFTTGRRPVLDSLSASAYGIYLIHYPVVVWLQFALLAVALSPIAKGVMVFVGAVALSWGIVAALRRIPPVARVL